MTNRRAGLERRRRRCFRIRRDRRLGPRRTIRSGAIKKRVARQMDRAEIAAPDPGGTASNVSEIRRRPIESGDGRQGRCLVLNVPRPGPGVRALFTVH